MARQQPGLPRKMQDGQRDEREGERHRQPREDRQRRPQDRRHGRLAADQRADGRRSHACQREDDRQGSGVPRPQQQQDDGRADDRHHLEQRPGVDGDRPEPDGPRQRPRGRPVDTGGERGAISTSHAHLEGAARAQPIRSAPPLQCGEVGGGRRGQVDLLCGQQVGRLQDHVALAQAGGGRGRAGRDVADDYRARERGRRGGAGGQQAQRDALEHRGLPDQQRAVAGRRKEGTDGKQLQQRAGRRQRHHGCGKGPGAPANAAGLCARSHGHGACQASRTPGMAWSKVPANAAGSGRRCPGSSMSGGAMPAASASRCS